MMHIVRKPRHAPSLESRILRVIVANDELVEIAIEAENAEALHFTEAQLQGEIWRRQ